MRSINGLSKGSARGLDSSGLGLPLLLVDQFQGISGVLLIVLAVVGLFLAVLAVLMPYFIWQIHVNVEKMREMAEGRPNGVRDVDDILPILKEIHTAMRDIHGLLRSGVEVRNLTDRSDELRNQIVASLAEQQRTINALRGRLDELEGTSPPQQRP